MCRTGASAPEGARIVVLQQGAVNAPVRESYCADWNTSVGVGDIAPTVQ